jgi:predicted nucleotidyltransferase
VGMVMNLEILRQKYKKQIMAIAKNCHVGDIRVFGSVARGDARDDSDVDFLVHVEPEAGFSVGGLYWQLEELLGCKVDIVPDSSIHWAIRDRILKEAVPL